MPIFNPGFGDGMRIISGGTTDGSSQALHPGSARRTVRRSIPDFTFSPPGNWIGSVGNGDEQPAEALDADARAYLEKLQAIKEKEREEAARIALIPMKITITEENRDGGIVYNVEAKRGESIYNGWRTTNKLDAIRMFASFKKDHAVGITRDAFEERAQGIHRVDLRGNRISARIRSDRPRRIDRRARRPVDDVVGEEGLTININAEELDKQPVTASTSFREEWSEIELDSGFDDEDED